MDGNSKRALRIQVAQLLGLLNGWSWSLGWRKGCFCLRCPVWLASAASGFEFATGPNLSPTGLSFVFAVGFNYTKGDLNMPINIALVPDKMGPRTSGLDGIVDVNDYFDVVRMRETGYRLTLSVGFNLSGK